MKSGGKSNFTFAQVPRADIPRSTFVRDHCYKTTFDSGYLIPFYVDEALPGDTFHVNVHGFARMATPIVPLMDNLYLDMFFFAVPNRLVWDNWQRFCGEEPNPGDSIDFTVPVLADPGAGGFAEGSIYDYMGLPTKESLLGATVNALHLRAYNLIWNEWFRDENLNGRAPENRDDGPDAIVDYNLLRRNKRHDYFTSCLPWPQKNVGVDIPIGNVQARSVGSQTPTFRTGGLSAGRNLVQTNAVAGVTWNPVPAATGAATWDDPALEVVAGTINDLREAYQIQRLLERDARGGTRYVELLKAHFGVTSPDARLQRPEFLGGGSTPVVINPVSQTSSTDATTPQGNLAAYGVVGARNGFTKSFVEHCVILGLLMVRADLGYQNGLHRMWSRRTRYDFFWPALAHLGEQAVLRQEIDITGGSAVFGYQERWAEYRYAPSKVTGKFRSNATGTLDFWHLAQELNAVVLNSSFMAEDPPIERVIAVPTEPQFLFDSYINAKCARPMPLYSVPGLSDHF